MTTEIKIERSLADHCYHVEGIPGMYQSRMQCTFNHVKYFPGDGSGSVLIGSVPGGVYGSPGITPKGNPQAREMILKCITNHASRMLAS